MSLLKRIQRSHKSICGDYDWRFQKMHTSALGHHSFFQQFHDGLPVSDAWLRVDENAKGKVIYHASRPRLKSVHLAEPRTKMPNARKRVELLKSITAEMQTSVQPLGDPELLFRRVGRRFVCEVKLNVASEEKPHREATIYVDSKTLTIRSMHETHFCLSGQGKIFSPHPLAHFSATSLPLNGEIPEILYREVEIPGLAGNGFLDGTFVTTSATGNRIKRADNDFRVTRTSKGFGEVMAYSHIDSVQRYIESLGFKNVRSQAVKVNVNSGETSSRYLPLQDLVLLGGDNVPDAEDAEIIVHEFAHAVHSAICPPLGKDDVSVNIAEGLADYFAASFFAAFKSDQMRPLIGAWDMYGGVPTSSPPFLRRVDRKTRFSQIVNSLHGRSDNVTEFWGSTLWDIYQEFGRERADILILGSLYVLKKNMTGITFFSAAEAIVKANQLGYHDSDRAKLIQMFTQRGIFAP